MGMSTHVYGIKPPDDDWRKMKAVYDACKAAHIIAPIQVEKFFDGSPPDESVVLVSLTGYPDNHDAVTEYSNDHQEGYEIDVTKLPADIKVVRVVNSW